jgi:S1-C subfamily serine protease
MSQLLRDARRAVLTTGVALFCAAASSQPFHPAHYLPIAASVVRVEADLLQGKLSVGSGVTVAPGVIATSCHVVHDAVGIRVAGAGATWPVDAERADAHHDVCFLRVPGWLGKPVAMAATSEPAVGSTVVALGFTGGAAIMPRVGNVRALHEYEGGRVIESDAAFNSGSSGGGLFDDEGALVGLLTFRLRNSDMSYYAVPVEWVRDGIPREEQWAGIAPLADARPFWQGEVSELPEFMRAAVAQGASKRE